MESAAKRLLHKGGSDRKCDGIQAGVAGRLCACLQICENDMTIHTQLSAVLALAEKATPGEWFYVHGHGWCIKPEHQPPVIRDASEYDGPQSYDEAFIRACANLIRQHGKNLLAAVEGWRPIESAPRKHCENIRLFGDGVGIASCEMVGYWYDYGAGRANWVLLGQSSTTLRPTHWQPISEPPAAMTKETTDAP